MEIFINQMYKIICHFHIILNTLFKHFYVICEYFIDSKNLFVIAMLVG